MMQRNGGFYSSRDQELKKEEALEIAKIELYQVQEYGQWIEAELEVLRRKHSSKSSFKDAQGILWDRIIKTMDKHWDHMELLQEKIETKG